MNLDITDFLAAILLLFGGGLLITGSVMLKNRAPVWFGGVRIKAKLLNVGRVPTAIRTPSVGFSVNGKSYEVTIYRVIPSNKIPYDLMWPIRYDPNNPEMAFDDTWRSILLKPLFTAIAGLFVVLLALAIFFGKEPPGGWPKYEPPPFTRN